MSDYVVPAAVLNTAYGNPNAEFGGMPCTDEVYRIPDEWLKANARRFYFTDQQITDAAVTKFETPNLGPYTRCFLIYFLIDEGEIVYVGQSRDFDNRLEAHRKSGKQFDSFAWFEAPDLYLKQIEAYYIDRIQPFYNGEYPSTSGFGKIARAFEDPELRKVRRQWVTTITPTSITKHCEFITVEQEG